MVIFKVLDDIMRASYFGHTVEQQKGEYINTASGSFPVILPATALAGIWKAANDGSSLGNIAYTYSKGITLQFTNCTVKKFEMRCSAGERIDLFLDFNFDSIEDAEPFDGNSTPRRVATWVDANTDLPFVNEITSVAVLKEKGQRAIIEIETLMHPIHEPINPKDFNFIVNGTQIIEKGSLDANVVCTVRYP